MELCLDVLTSVESSSKKLLLKVGLVRLFFFFSNNLVSEKPGLLIRDSKKE